jgi:4-amino-4-deoxy-L-arabinose transferase-like glycosyltransferase
MNQWLARGIAWGLILIGIAGRVRLYLNNRSLGRDEAALALNIVQRNFFGMFKPLANDQAAPIGFLILQKITVTIAGGGEKALRFVPLIASITALVLFWPLCKRLLSRRAALIALAVLSLAAKQYYFASDNKQYSLDVCIAVGLLYLAQCTIGAGAEPKNPSQRDLILLGAGGAAAVWFSHPAIYVLGGITLAAAMDGAISRERIVHSLYVLAAWGVSFSLNFLLILHRLSHNDYMQWFWSLAGGFAPVPKSPGALIWYKKAFFKMFEDPMLLEFMGLAGFVYLLGLVALYRRRRSLLVLMLAPILLAVAASMLHKYPFASRMILFIAPLVAATIGAGIDLLGEGGPPLGTWTGWIALVLLMISPVTSTAGYLKSGLQDHEIRDSMAFIQAHKQPGDIYYVYPFCEYGFDYYKDRFGLADATVIVGSQDVASWDAYAAELRQLAGHRVWVLFEDTADHGGINEQQMALHILDTMGKRYYEDKPRDEYVALYELNP